MDGIEKIKARITADAEKHASDITASAQKQADRILSEAEQKAGLVLSEAEEFSENERRQILLRAQAGARQLEKRSVLKAKTDCVTDVIKAAGESFSSMPREKYFAALHKIALANLQSGSGVIRFNAEDLKTLPDDFTSDLEGIVLDNAPADIADGFILVYGNIEYNCTIAALISEKNDLLTEKVYKILFPSEV